MKNLFRHKRTICTVLLMMLFMFAIGMPAMAAEAPEASEAAADGSVGAKSIAAAIAVGLAAAWLFVFRRRKEVAPIYNRKV